MRPILLAVALLLLTTSAAWATDARIQSLGGKEKAWTVADETNALTLPATVLLWGNTIFVDAGIMPAWAIDDKNKDDLPYNVGFGTFLKLSPDTVLALYGSSLSQYVSNLAMQQAFGWSIGGSSFDNDEVQGPDAVHRANHQGTIILGQRFGSTRAGLSISMWGDGYEQKTPQEEQARRGAMLFELGLGLGFDMEHENSFDASLRLRVGQITDEIYTSAGLRTRVKADPALGGELLARGIFDIPGGEKLIPYLDFAFASGGALWNQQMPTGDVAPEVTYSQLAGTIGTDLLIQPLEGVYIYPGIGLGFQTTKVEDQGNTVQDDRDFLLPFFGFGVDARVASWLALRFAARQTVVFSKEADDSKDIRSQDVVSEYYTGMGLKFGAVDIDLLVNPELLTSGPNVISGKNLNDGFATQAAIRFIW